MERAVALAGALLWMGSLPAAGSAQEAWGEYPNCIAPAVPLEVQGWWWQRGEPFPRHLHHAACIPNARTADCSDGRNPIVDRPQPFTSRIVSYNNPHEVNWIRWSWQSGVVERVDVDWRCDPGEVVAEGLEQCVWQEEMTLDPLEGSGGLDELRLSPNIRENEFGLRQFATLNFQVCTGTSSEAYRSHPDPIGRAWYEGLDYSNVRVNYMDFYRGSLTDVIPTVSGVVTLDIDHQRGSGENRSLLWLDTNHHLNPGQFGDPPPVGEVQAHGGVLLYDEPGLFDGTYAWDTSALPDGVHALFFQTLSTGADGTSAGGLKLLFRVANGNGPLSGSDAPTEPDPEPTDPAPGDPGDPGEGGDPATGAYYELHVEIQGRGAVELDPPGGLYPEGTVVILGAEPEPGFEFRGWSGDLSGEASPATLRVDSTSQVRARFRKQSRRR